METILFQHIPKTAGSTVLQLLRKYYKDEDIFHIDGLNPHNSIDQFQKMPSSQRKGFKLIMGHLTNHLEPFIENSVVKILFLREPVDHFISSYYYIKRAPWNKYHEEVKRLKSLKEFVEYRSQSNMDNLQTRHIAGETGFLLMDTEPDKPLPYESYEKALKIITEADLAFLTEELDQSLLILKDRFDWKRWPFYKSKNVTKKRPTVQNLDDNVIKAIKEHNKYDLLLYEGLKRHNVNRYRDYHNLKVRKEMFSIINRLYNFF